MSTHSKFMMLKYENKEWKNENIYDTLDELRKTAYEKYPDHCKNGHIMSIKVIIPAITIY